MGRDVATRNSKPELIVQLERVAPQLARLGIPEDRFVRVLLTETRKNPKLLECSPPSFLAAAFSAAQLGLEPGQLGHFWLVPRRIQGTWEVVPIIGYRGLVELARRAGVIITPGTVYARDHYVEHQGTAPRIDHQPYIGDDRGDPVRWYAVARFPDGRAMFRSLTRADVETRRHAGSSGNSPAWKNWYDAMARKTAIRALWAQLPTLPALDDVDRIDGQVLHLADQSGHVTVVTTDPDDGDDSEAELPSGQDATPEPDPDPDGGAGSGDGDADDRQLLAIVTLQGQVGLDDHDLAELVRDRFDVDGDTVDELLRQLDTGQAGDLIAHLQGGDGP